MGMFAETGNINYRLSFADQGQKTYISSCSEDTAVFVFRIYRYIYIYITYVYTLYYIYTYVCM
jgi:hypothetical protein